VAVPGDLAKTDCMSDGCGSRETWGAYASAAELVQQPAATLTCSQGSYHVEWREIRVRGSIVDATLRYSKRKRGTGWFRGH
jgi:hypothetical protein